MFEIDSKKIINDDSTVLIKKNINLDKNLDAFILVKTIDKNFSDLVLNNILDCLIDKISKENTYSDFSLSLENINSFISNWRKDSEHKLKLSIIIWILNEDNFIFSNIWKSSCFILNKRNEVIELTSKDENKKEFNYISSWQLKHWEIIISCSSKLLKYITKSDLIDWLVLSDNIEIFNKNIKNILESEILKENIIVNSLKYSWEAEEKENYDVIKDFFIKIIDNNFAKTIIWYFLVLKDKINKQSKLIKNIMFLSLIAISIFSLYSILGNVVWETIKTEQKLTAENNITKAKNLVKLASENISTPEVFETNITQAEDLIEENKENKLFLNDLVKLNNDINILKKQFNKVEIFEEKTENIILKEDFEKPIKIIKNNLKPYIITSKWVVWPILPNIKAKNYIFNSLDEDEEFVDASFIWDNMFLLTSSWKIARFSKNGYFSYSDVSWQNAWEKAKKIDTYSQNIYLLWEEDNQIYKHWLYWKNFKAWKSYFKKDDLTQIWEILSIAIDWWFYILKKDLSIIKFFSYPYRIEKLILNKLPKNYDIEDPESIIDLKARSDLKYVYLLMNNKIWIFMPNTKDYRNTKHLTYIWQIEWNKNSIKDFFVNHDWEILILNKKWLYKINFEVSNDKVLIR